MIDSATSSYEIPDSLLAGLSTSGHSQRMAAVASWIEAHSVRTRDTRINRYARYLGALERNHSDMQERIFVDPPGHPFKSLLDRFLYVLREVHELLWIYESFKDREIIGLHDKLEQLVGGADFAALDRRSISRDIQFELRIAGYLARADFQIDLSTLTDVVARKSDQILHVECKRIASPKQLHRRIKEAGAQLAGRMPEPGGRVAGLIALDVTKVAFVHNGLTLGLTADHSRDLLRQKLVSIYEELGAMEWAFQHDSHIGLFFQIHIPSVILNPPQSTTRLSGLVVESPQINAAGLDMLHALCKILPSGVDMSLVDRPAQKVKIRQRVEFEPGTELRWDPSILTECLTTGVTAKWDDDYEVMHLKKAGVAYTFYFLELKLALAQLSESELRRIKSSRQLFAAEMMARLYIQRYRYEEAI